MSANGSADLVFVNGPVYTVDQTRSRARAVAVTGGRISAVGDDEEIRQHVGPHTEVIDLNGRLLLPGFQDSHIHPVASGVDMLQCDLTSAYALADYERIIARVRRRTPRRRVDPGRRMVHGHRSPAARRRRRSWTRLVPDRPVFLPSRDGHSGWVNSRALELAGVDRADARSRGRPDRADAGRRAAAARCTRAPWSSVGRLAPTVTAGDVGGGPLASRSVPALARDHRLAGRDRRTRGWRTGRTDAYVDAAGAGRPHRPRGGRALVGPPPRRWSRSTSCWSSRANGPGRAVQRRPA